MQKKLTILFVSIVFLLFVGLSDSYAEHKKNPNAGHGGGGGGDVPGNFTVTVFIEVGGNFMQVGSAVNVVGDSDFDQGHFRASLGATDMIGNLDLLDTLALGCPLLGGANDGRFAISTARHEENGPITSVGVSFFNFTALDGVSYGVFFDNGVLNDLTKWLPGPGTMITWTGNEVSLAVAKGPTKKGPCNGTITQDWKAVVFNNAPVL